MSRLQSEVRRLYLLPDPGGPGENPRAADGVDAAGRVRTMVLQLARPADWAALSRVWQGVQGDLALPAPAIAVSGKDAYQLWFSWLEPVAAAEARAFLESLRVRYLGDIQPARVSLMPRADATSPPHALQAEPVPALQPATGFWSAFVAPDLASLFADEPWLDMPPNMDGQAGLLSGLQSMQPDDFERALERLRPAAVPPPGPPALTAHQAHEAVPATAADRPDARWARQGEWLDPRHFLLEVMNDGAVALALRIDAAKALLHQPGEG